MLGMPSKHVRWATDVKDPSNQRPVIVGRAAYNAILRGGAHLFKTVPHGHTSYNSHGYEPGEFLRDQQFPPEEMKDASVIESLPVGRGKPDFSVPLRKPFSIPEGQAIAAAEMRGAAAPARKPVARGRGLLNLNEPVRKPGHFVDEVKDIEKHVDSPFVALKTMLNSIDISNEAELSDIATTIRSACRANSDMKLAVDIVYNFSMKSSVNAHFGASLVFLLKDFGMGSEHFKSLMFNMIQVDYEDRVKKYANDRQAFLMSVCYICELFHHVRLPNGACFDFFSMPILEYFNMVLENDSENFMLVLAEQLPRCYDNLRKLQEEEVNKFLVKMRIKIISSSSPVPVRALILRTFEQILIGSAEIENNAQVLYSFHSKPVTKICE